MTHRIHQKGSALHIILIVIAVLAILGAVGFVLWQNFFQPTASDQGNKTPVTEGPPEDYVPPTSASSSVGGYTVNYVYPSNWKKDGDTVTSPDGQVAVMIELWQPDGLGGTCGDDSEAITDPLVSLQWEVVTGYTKALFVKAISETGDVNNKTYNAIFNLQPASREAIKTAEAGDSFCRTFSAVPTLIPVAKGDDYTTVLNTSVLFKDLTNESGVMMSSDSKETIEKLFSSELATEAQKILQSVTVTADK